MPPLPPVHEPKRALSVEFQECYDAVHALLPVLPSIHIRGAWHQQRLALQVSFLCVFVDLSISDSRSGEVQVTILRDRFII